jgi:hypothetical protein
LPGTSVCEVHRPFAVLVFRDQKGGS